MGWGGWGGVSVLHFKRSELMKCLFLKIRHQFSLQGLLSLLFFFSFSFFFGSCGTFTSLCAHMSTL